MGRRYIQPPKSQPLALSQPQPQPTGGRAVPRAGRPSSSGTAPQGSSSSSTGVVVAPWDRPEEVGLGVSVGRKKQGQAAAAAAADQTALPPRVEHGDDGRLVGGLSHTAELAVPRKRMVGPQPEPQADDSRMLSGDGFAIARRKRYEPKSPEQVAREEEAAAEAPDAQGPAPAGRLRATISEHQGAAPPLVVSHTGLSPTARRTEYADRSVLGLHDEPQPASFGRAAGEFLLAGEGCTWESPKTASARRKFAQGHVTAKSSAAAACLGTGSSAGADGEPDGAVAASVTVSGQEKHGSGAEIRHRRMKGAGPSEQAHNRTNHPTVLGMGQVEACAQHARQQEAILRAKQREFAAQHSRNPITGQARQERPDEITQLPRQRRLHESSLAGLGLPPSGEGASRRMQVHDDGGNPALMGSPRVKSSLHAQDLPGRDATWGDGNVSFPAGRLVSPERHKRSVALSPGQAVADTVWSPSGELASLGAAGRTKATGRLLSPHRHPHRAGLHDSSAITEAIHKYPAPTTTPRRDRDNARRLASPQREGEW